MAAILLADDHQLVRDTIAAYLSGSGGFEVFTAQDLDDAVVILNAHVPVDLAIFDYMMPGMDGLAGFARVRELVPDLKTAIMSGVAKPAVAEEAIALGARGYFPKSIPVSAMVDGIHRVLAGEIVRDLISSCTGSSAASSVQDRFGLTSREAEILEMLAQGTSNKVIAGTLDLKEVTVKFHVTNIMTKLKVTNRTQAALLARNETLA